MEPTGCNVISKEELEQWLDWLAKDGLGKDIVDALKAIPVVKRKRKMVYYLHMPCTCRKMTVIVGLDKDGNGVGTCGYCGKQYKVGIKLTIEEVNSASK